MTPLLLFLLACAAIYVSTVQAAFTILMRLSFRLLAERNGRDERLVRYLEDPFLLLVPARVLTAAILVAATLLLASILGGAGEHGLKLAGVIILAFVLACQQGLPLVVARRDPERVLQALLPAFDAVTRLLQPLTRALFRVAHRSERSPAANGDEETGRGGEPTPTAEPQGLDEGDQRRLLRSVFDFGDTLVREVMTPRPDIVAIRAEATLDELRALLQEQEYSRLPVFRKHLDDIVGVVFIKDLIHRSAASGDERLDGSLMRPPYFVPESKRVAELLKEFQLRQVQSAIVVDEYGGTAGLVTLEDLLEELVGEIRDEYDVEPEPVVDEGNGSFLFAGMANIDEVGDRLGVRIERQGFETVGGFLLSHLGRVPTVGESFAVDHLWVEVLEAERRRVTKVRIRPDQTVPQSPAQ